MKVEKQSNRRFIIQSSVFLFFGRSSSPAWWTLGAWSSVSRFDVSRAHPDILKALNISNWFFERWCKEAPPQLFSLEDFSSWNDGTVRTLLSYPRVRAISFRPESVI